MYGIENICVIGVDGDGSNVDVFYVEGVESKVFFVFFGRLGGSVGRERRGSSFVNEEIDVEIRGKSVVKIGWSKVDSLRVGDYDLESLFFLMVFLIEFNDFFFVIFIGVDSSFNFFVGFNGIFFFVLN